MREEPIYFEATGKAGEVTGSFTAFGRPEGAMSRAGGKIKLMLAFIKVDKTVQQAEIDITEVVTDSENGGEGDVGEPPTEIELPLDDQVEVEKPTTNPDGGGGGIGGDVGDWGEEDEVILPVE